MLFSTPTFCRLILNLPWFSVPLSYPWGQLTSACVLSHVWLCNPLDYNLPGSSVHWDFSGKNTGVGCHFLFQGISWSRDRTRVSCISCIAAGFFTHWAIRDTFPNFPDQVKSLYSSAYLPFLALNAVIIIHRFVWLFDHLCLHQQTISSIRSNT